MSLLFPFCLVGLIVGSCLGLSCQRALSLFDTATPGLLTARGLSTSGSCSLEHFISLSSIHNDTCSSVDGETETDGSKTGQRMQLKVKRYLEHVLAHRNNIYRKVCSITHAYLLPQPMEPGTWDKTKGDAFKSHFLPYTLFITF